MIRQNFTCAVCKSVIEYERIDDLRDTTDFYYQIRMDATLHHRDSMSNNCIVLLNKLKKELQAQLNYTIQQTLEHMTKIIQDAPKGSGHYLV